MLRLFTDEITAVYARIFNIIFVLFLSTLAALLNVAQSGAAPFIPNNNWKFYVAEEDWGESCFISTVDATPTIEFMSGRGEQKPIMLLEDNGGPFSQFRNNVAVTVVIDADVFRLTFAPDDYFGTLATYDVNKSLLSSFAKGTTISIILPDHTTLRYDLAGSLTVTKQFMSCAY